MSYNLNGEMKSIASVILDAELRDLVMVIDKLWIFF